ncbi:MAG: aminotransferase class IV [Solirubrobacterales bacterium]
MKDMEGKFFLINGEQNPVEEFNENLILQGSTVYEVLRVIKGKPLFYDLHIDRLHNSAKLVHKKIGINNLLIKEQIKKLININHIESGNVKIAFNNGNLYMFKIKHKFPSDEDYTEGVKAVLFMGERKDPNIKLIDIDFRTRANEKIKENDAYEAVLVDRNGFITEGSRSNIFMVKDNTLITAPVSEVLPGITRSVIIKSAVNLGMKFREAKVSYKDIANLDGMFISGTSPKILPVKQVDDIILNSAENPQILKLMTEYQRILEEDIVNFQL